MEIDLQDEISAARELIKKPNGSTSVYDEISTLITTVLDERPIATPDLVEKLLNNSPDETEKKEREDRYEPKSGLADTQIKLFEKYGEEEAFPEGGNNENEEEYEIPLPNCTQLDYYFEQAGIGVGREETYRIYLALKQLVFNYQLSSIRFWGKIFGLEANYIIAEGEFREGEGEEEEEEVEETLEEEDIERNKENMPENEEGPSEEENIPKSTYKPPPEVPKEEHRTGVNKKVYFVCNEAGEEWIKLPHTTPKEINASRSITKFFTGRLDAMVDSYPPFHGNEGNLLRAQIARISASTQISPAGYFIFDDEDDDDDEDYEGRDSYMLNVDFEGISLKELSDPQMLGWVHHCQHILPQGRCSWFNVHQKPEDDFEMESFEDDEDSFEDAVKPESGPPLLSTVAGEKALGDHPPWTVALSSRVLPEYSIAVARSNRWPGAYAFATSRTFENIYIGWGKKYTGGNFNPATPPVASNEFPEGVETTEQDDPTVEEERALEEREKELKAAEDMDGLDDEEDDDDE